MAAKMYIPVGVVMTYHMNKRIPVIHAHGTMTLNAPTLSA
jgi:hypothetical protein